MATKTNKKRTVPIRIDEDIVQQLKKMGVMHESYSDVLRRIMKLHRNKKVKEDPDEAYDKALKEVR